MTRKGLPHVQFCHAWEACGFSEPQILQFYQFATEQQRVDSSLKSVHEAVISAVQHLFSKLHCVLGISVMW
jgi:hypothetical protein